MQIITQTAHNADAIISPAQSINASSLTLTVPTISKNPTTFDLSGGIIRITEGAEAPIALNNSRIVASAIAFQNVSRTNTPGIIRISFTLVHANPDGRNEYDYSKTFYGSVSLKQP